MRCVAGEDGVSGQTITVYFGRCVIGGARFSGATAAGEVYVAEGSDNGKYTQTAPSTSGDYNTVQGVALDATTLIITPNHAIDSTA
jgi:hypothetical protein